MVSERENYSFATKATRYEKIVNKLKIRDPNPRGGGKRRKGTSSEKNVAKKVHSIKLSPAAEEIPEKGQALSG